MERPVQVSIYLEDGCWAGVAILLKELLAIAGTLLSRNIDLREAELFQVSMVAEREGAVRSFTGTEVVPDRFVRRWNKAYGLPDVIVVPPHYFYDAQPATMRAGLKRWLTRAYERGAILVGFDGGVRVLAASGLLDGHEVTGNPSDQKVFVAHYRQIRFSPQVPLIVDGRILSATGTAPCMDACAYLVGHFFGEAAAHKFIRYTHPRPQPAYEPAELQNAGWKKHADLRIRQGQEFIERYFNQDISVQDAARRASMSLRNFTRRFQSAVGISPQRYIAHCRVQHAKKLLETKVGPVLQVALECGFNNEASLRRVFDQLCGQTPMQYRKAVREKRTMDKEGRRAG